MIQKQATSVVINWLRFPLIFLVILLHGYFVVQIKGTEMADRITFGEVKKTYIYSSVIVWKLQ